MIPVGYLHVIVENSESSTAPDRRDRIVLKIEMVHTLQETNEQTQQRRRKTRLCRLMASATRHIATEVRFTQRDNEKQRTAVAYSNASTK